MENPRIVRSLMGISFLPNANGSFSAADLSNLPLFRRFMVFTCP
jgi:hypothetical protein